MRGRPRSATSPSPIQPNEFIRCFNCDYFKTFRRGRCYGCDRFYRAMDTERPAHLIDRAIGKYLKRLITRGEIVEA